MKELDIEESLYEKVGTMNMLGNQIHYKLVELETCPFTDEETDEIYGVADGLTEEWVMNTLEGRCSLQRTLDWGVERVEHYVDEKILTLKKYLQKLN